VDILVVDDDRDIADIIGYSLRKEGHRPILGHRGGGAGARRASAADLVVLDDAAGPERLRRSPQRASAARSR
jgi:DNA-binding response OmpR family regulator